MTDSISEQLGDATNVLLGAPSMGQGTAGACVDLLSIAPPEDLRILWVTFTKPASQCLAEWRDDHAADPDTYGVITIGETTGLGNADELDPGAVETVSNPSDLTGLGIKIGEFITGRDEQVVVCFDSLTALLQYVEIETTYEFLHALTGQLYTVDAISHFHIDPSAHDEQTVDTLLMLFDAYVDLGADEPTVRSRYPLKVTADD